MEMSMTSNHAGEGNPIRGSVPLPEGIINHFIMISNDPKSF